MLHVSTGFNRKINFFGFVFKLAISDHLMLPREFSLDPAEDVCIHSNGYIEIWKQYIFLNGINFAWAEMGQLIN